MVWEGGGEALTSKANMSNVGITGGNYNTFIKSVTFNIEICKNSIAKKN